MKHIVRHKDGSIWAKGEMENGECVGYWEWYRKNGTRMRSGYFTNGHKTGKWTTYGKNGKEIKTTLINKEK